MRKRDIGRKEDVWIAVDRGKHDKEEQSTYGVHCGLVGHPDSCGLGRVRPKLPSKSGSPIQLGPYEIGNLH